MISTDDRITHRAQPVLIHVATSDISLALLLGPQLEAFRAAGYEVIGASSPGPFVESLVRAGIRHVPLRHTTRAMAVGRDLRAFIELYELFASLKPDIVHTHNPKPGLYGRLAARAAGVPVIVNTVHGLYAVPADSLGKRAVVYGIERIAAAFSHAELIQNPEDLAVLARLRVPRRKLHLLGNGIDLERFGAGTSGRGGPEEMAQGSDSVTFGAVGRLVWEKGYREVFTAAEILATECPAARIVIAGPHDREKPDAIPERDIARVSATGVRFLGHRDDIEAVYGSMDVFVLASYREGFSRSGMEAAAMGLPIIATDVRGCRQVVDDGVTGLLVPPHDARSLADAMIRLAGDPLLRERMGHAAIAKARAEFDQRAVIDLTLRTYERLLGSVPSRRVSGRAPQLASPDSRRHYNKFPYDVGVSGSDYALGAGPLGDFLRSIDGGTAIDIGCGPGNVLPALVGRARLAIGVDISEASLRIAARRSGGAVVIHADARCLPFAEGSADSVVATGSLHHTGDAARGFEELARVLRPGGRAFVAVYAAESYYQRLYTTVGAIARRCEVRPFTRVAVNRVMLEPAFGAYLIAGRLATHRRLTWPSRRHLRNYFADQLLNPVVTFHSLDELRRWAAAAGLDVQSTSRSHAGALVQMVVSKPEVSVGEDRSPSKEFGAA